MKCMCAQTRPRFILSSEGVLGGMEFEPMLRSIITVIGIVGSSSSSGSSIIIVISIVSSSGGSNIRSGSCSTNRSGGGGGAITTMTTTTATISNVNDDDNIVWVCACFFVCVFPCVCVCVCMCAAEQRVSIRGGALPRASCPEHGLVQGVGSLRQVQDRR